MDSDLNKRAFLARVWITSFSPAMSSKAALETLRTALYLRDPYVSGTCPIPADDFVVYYGIENDARSVNRPLRATMFNIITSSGESICPKPLPRI